MNQLRAHEKDITNPKVVEKVSRSRPTEFYMVVVPIEESKDFTQFYMHKLIGSLLSHERRMKMNEDSLENSFKIESFISRGL